jgi:hypothetical protein
MRDKFIEFLATVHDADPTLVESVGVEFDALFEDYGLRGAARTAASYAIPGTNFFRGASEVMKKEQKGSGFTGKLGAFGRLLNTDVGEIRKAAGTARDNRIHYKNNDRIREFMELLKKTNIGKHEQESLLYNLEQPNFALRAPYVTFITSKNRILTPEEKREVERLRSSGKEIPANLRYPDVGAHAYDTLVAYLNQYKQNRNMNQQERYTGQVSHEQFGRVAPTEQELAELANEMLRNGTPRSELTRANLIAEFARKHGANYSGNYNSHTLSRAASDRLTAMRDVMVTMPNWKGRDPASIPMNEVLEFDAKIKAQRIAAGPSANAAALALQQRQIQPQPQAQSQQQPQVQPQPPAAQP